MASIPAFSPQRNGLLRGAEPFSFDPPPGDSPAHRNEATGAGCLLVHGFTSTPYDARSCGEYLAAAGIPVEGVLLDGHGTCPEELATTRLADWLRSIREGYDRLAGRCEHIFGLGISLSGNFLLSLAPFTDFAGLILIGTPLTFRHERAYRAAYQVLRAVGKRYQKKWYLEHLDETIRAQRPTYDRFPLDCAPDCLAAVTWSRQNLPLVQCPVLIAQSTTDHAVDKRTIAEFCARLGTTDVNVEWFPNRYHVLLIDHGAEEVFATVRRFIVTRTPRMSPRPAAHVLLTQPAVSPA